MAQPLLDIKNLSIAFDTSRGQVRPVRDVSLSIFPGQTVALVGESGCGKSVTALSVLRLIPQPPGRVLGGQILWDGRDLLQCSERQMRGVRGKDIAMIFQEPMTSLNPVYTIGDQIIEAVMLHQNKGRGDAWRLAEQSLREVGIADPGRRLGEYPHQMSGGMRQRVMIAMALSCKPRLLIADEPTTALDVTIQAQILDLLRKLQRDTGMAILLITHDLGVVAENADVVGVMYASRLVELATVEDLFDHPSHPYTNGLFSAMPKLGRRSLRLATIPGVVPNPAHFPVGCKFHPRCQLTRELARKLCQNQVKTLAQPSLGVPGECQGEGLPPGAGPSPSDTAMVESAGERFAVMRPCVRDEPVLRQVLPSHWGSCHYIEGFAAAPLVQPVLQHKRQVTASTTDGSDENILASAKEESHP